MWFKQWHGDMAYVLETVKIRNPDHVLYQYTNNEVCAWFEKDYIICQVWGRCYILVLEQDHVLVYKLDSEYLAYLDMTSHVADIQGHLKQVVDQYLTHLMLR